MKKLLLISFLQAASWLTATAELEKEEMIAQKNPEMILLIKFAGQFSTAIYTMLRHCLQEKNEKTTMACQSGFKLFNKMESVIKERNIVLSQEEHALLKQMEEKYSAGPSYQPVELKNSRSNAE